MENMMDDEEMPSCSTLDLASDAESFIGLRDISNTTMKSTDSSSSRHILNARRRVHAPELSHEMKAKEVEIPLDPNIDYTDFGVLSDLGEGTFGQVKLLYDKKKPSRQIAVKVVDLSENKKMAKACVQEGVLLKLVRRHPNIIHYLSMRLNESKQFQLFLEYADGGELFDRIEPDIGLPVEQARRYFIQLIDGLEYIHANGIVHRDIKPENILLTKKDVLKISDFGLATIYKDLKSERYLTEPCGTPQYVAPEVITCHYKGEPVDIWSAAVVLLVMLTGDMPWEEPTKMSPTFVQFIREKDFNASPWNRIGTEELSVLQLMLVEDYYKRANFERIRKHPWLADSGDKRSLLPSPIPTLVNAEYMGLAATQPPALTCLSMVTASQRPDVFCSQLPKKGLPRDSFSQPADCIDGLILSHSQVVGNSQGSIYHPIQSFVQRMTRFCTSLSVFELIDHIEDACAALGCSTSFLGPQQILVKTVLQKRDLRYVVRIYEMKESGRTKQLVDVRCSTGFGMDFKRAFAAFKDQLSPFVCTESDNWLRELGLLPGAVKTNK